jgi:hypothetical protein
MGKVLSRKRVYQLLLVVLSSRFSSSACRGGGDDGGVIERGRIFGRVGFLLLVGWVEWAFCSGVLILPREFFTSSSSREYGYPSGVSCWVREKLCVLKKSYRRMWHEIRPQGPGGVKPLRE